MADMITYLPPSPELVPQLISPGVAQVYSRAANASDGDMIEFDDDVKCRWLACLHKPSSQARTFQKVMPHWHRLPNQSGWATLNPAHNSASGTIEYPSRNEEVTVVIAANNGIEDRSAIVSYCQNFLIEDAVLSGELNIFRPVSAFDSNRIEDTVLSGDLSVSSAVSAFDSIVIDDATKAKIDEIAALQADWDGPGSIPPTIDAVREARHFLANLKAIQWLPDVSAGQDGEVNISWRNDKIYIDLSFYRAGGASMYARVDKKVFKKRDGVFTISDLPPALLTCLSVS